MAVCSGRHIGSLIHLYGQQSFWRAGRDLKAIGMRRETIQGALITLALLFGDSLLTFQGPA